MEPAGRGLDEVADLLGRWSGTSGPGDRLQVVTEAARVLRDLKGTDRRVLARQLFEHGAPDAAQKIAQQTGGTVSADQLNDAAYALLSVDQRELDGLAQELRDPEERRRVVEAAGVALRAATDAAPPPEPPSRLEVPPPPGAQAAVDDRDGPDGDGARPGDADAAPGGGTTAGRGVATKGVDAPPDDGRGRSGTHSDLQPSSGPAGRDAPSVTTHRTRATPCSRFVDDLSVAANGPERLALLDEHRMDLDAEQLVEVLGAVPDGWQRRTVLRRLLMTRRIDPIGDASGVVTAFARRSDRFAAAARLTRSGIADVVPLLAHLDPADARRLRRRYTT